MTKDTKDFVCARNSVLCKKENFKNVANVLVTTQLDENILRVKISNKTINALVDTGASVSCISEHLCHKVIPNYSHRLQNEPGFIGKPTFSTIKDVCGEIHPVRGSVSLDFSINGLKVTQKFHIFTRLQHQMILGIDFLKDYKASVHMGNSTISFYEGALEAPISIQLFQHQACDKAKAAYSVILKHRSQTCLMVKVPSKYHDNQVLIEPNTKTHKFMCAKTTDTVQGQYLSCLLLNATNVPIRVKKDMVVGSISSLDNSFPIEPIDNTQCQPHVGQVQGIDNTANINSEIKPDLNIDLDKSDLTENQKQKLRALIAQNRSVFATKLSELGSTNVYKHRFETKDETPVRSRHYRMSQEMKQLVESEIEQMLEHNIIEPSTTEWNSPIVMVRKKDGSYRMAADLRKLNSKCKPINFPLPRAEDIFDSIGQAKANYFSILDLVSGYWQIPLDPETKHKAGIVTHHGIWEWNKLPFGLVSAPAAFQKTMATVLRDLNWKQVLIYVDDVLVMSSTFDEHLDHLQQVFNRFRIANLTLKPSKCQFAAKEIVYLGYVITKEGIRPDPGKCKVIKTYPTPRNQKQVRQAMGLFNFYRRFVKGFSQIAAPLNAFLKTDTELFPSLPNVTVPGFHLFQQQLHTTIANDKSYHLS